MIKLELPKMTNAIARAKKIRPFVRWTGGRNFTVTSSDRSGSYSVRFAVVNGLKLASCTCKAGQANQLCYHVAAAAAVNIAIQSARKTSTRQAAASTLESCVTCGRELTPAQTRYVGGKRYCSPVCSGEVTPAPALWERYVALDADYSPDNAPLRRPQPRPTLIDGWDV